MNLDRIKPEQLAAGVMDYMPQSLAAHEYAERLNAALARLGLTDRLTLPPAPNTAIDELPAVVDVPLRKTLSVLMGKAQQGDASALATLEWTAQVMESIFAGLHARDFAGDRPLALPSHESLATLSQGVDALLPRKISNGAWSLLADGTPSDGIDDGVSLVRLLCSSAADSVTELKDDNEGWTMDKESCVQRLATMFPNITMHFNCKEVTAHVVRQDTTNYAVLYFDKCISIPTRFVGESSNGTNYGAPNYEVHMEALETTNQTENTYSSFYCGKVYLPAYKYGVLRMGGSASYSNMWMNYLYLGCKGNKDQIIRVWNYGTNGAIKDIEIGEGACQNLTLQYCDGLTAENMYNHILCRLKQDEPMCGEGVTITLGTTNIDKIEAVEEYNLKLTELTDIYGYTFA